MGIMSRGPSRDTLIDKKRLILCVYAVGHNQWDVHDYCEEFKSLVKTAGMESEHQMLLRLREVDGSYFFTKGKMQEVLDYCTNNEIEEIVLSSSLTGMQHRNLEQAGGIEVIDRTELILRIFKSAAISAEGKLQVEIAEINIAKTMISGRGKGMGQQQFGAGSRGPGETEKEYMYRHYSELILKAERKLKSLTATRHVQRKRRLKSGLPLVSLVGYTNAGKSSVLNGVARAKVLAEDKLFATLDTTTKEVFLSMEKKLLLADTVGFISELPHHLVKAFESTLDELQYADLLLHVVDISNNSWKKQIEVVLSTLDDLKIDQRMLYVFNKTDLATPEQMQDVRDFIQEFQENDEPLEFVFINTMNQESLFPLKEFLMNDPLLWEEKNCS